MPAKPSTSPEPDPTPAADTTPAPEPKTARRKADTDEPATLAGRLPAGTYQYTGTVPTQYLDVPLTARPATDGRPATVFAWHFGAPADGRWEPTKKQPTQVADNQPPAVSTEE